MESSTTRTVFAGIKFFADKLPNSVPKFHYFRNFTTYSIPRLAKRTENAHRGRHTSARFPEWQDSRPGSGVAGEGVLNIHVFELAAFEDFAALYALDEFRIGVAGDNLHPRMAAWLVPGTADGRLVALGLQ